MWKVIWFYRFREIQECNFYIIKNVNNLEPPRIEQFREPIVEVATMKGTRRENLPIVTWENVYI